MTPESGQGANQSIETAASLANHLERMVDFSAGKRSSKADIANCLAAFQASRQPRASNATTTTMINVRSLSYSTPVFKFMSLYIIPRLGDFIPNENCARYIGAERMEYLPVPAKSIMGTMLFNPEQGIVMEVSSGRRALLAMPLLVVPIYFTLLCNGESWPLLQLLDMPIYCIWLLEGSRRANNMTPI